MFGVLMLFFIMIVYVFVWFILIFDVYVGVWIGY